MGGYITIHFLWKTLSVMEGIALIAFFLSMILIAATGLYDMHDQGEEKIRNQKIFGVSAIVQLVAIPVFCIVTFQDGAGHVHYVLNPFILTLPAFIIGWRIRARILRNGTPLFKGWGGK